MLRARETDGYTGNDTIVSNRKITRQKPYGNFSLARGSGCKAKLQQTTRGKLKPCVNFSF